jgi:hypothetical protein
VAIILLYCSGESSEEPDPEYAVKFGLLVGKLNACLNHLEQFPIKVRSTIIFSTSSVVTVSACCVCEGFGLIIEYKQSWHC